MAISWSQLNTKLDRALSNKPKDIYVPLKDDPQEGDRHMNMLFKRDGSRVAYSGKFRLKIPLLNKSFVIGISLFPAGKNLSVSLWLDGRSAVDQGIISKEELEKLQEK